ncbi:MAG: hypothetical protein OHK0052_27080 [Anaerolineales bacterium]
MYSLPSLLTVVITLSLSIFAMRRQRVTGARVFAALMGAITWWATGNVLELNSPTLELKQIFSALQYVGVVA